MKSVTTIGIICVFDPQILLEYHVAKISYTENEDGSFSYSIYPNYSVIDLLEPPLFQGIPGINLDLHREEYKRTNKTPVFISERTPARNREDLWEMLDAEGMPYLNQLEWLVKTKTRYSGDSLYVKPETECSTCAERVQKRPRSAHMIKDILDAICAGKTIEGDGFIVDDANRSEIYALLKMLYVQEKKYLDEKRQEGVAQAKAQRKAGRRVKQVDQLKLIDAIERYQRGEINAEEAAKLASLSRATFYRRKKAFQLAENKTVAS